MRRGPSRAAKSLTLTPAPIRPTGGSHEGRVTSGHRAALVSTRKGYRGAVREGTEFVTGFRIDDDDAVAVDYIAGTRAVAKSYLEQGWADAETPAVIAFHRGIDPASALTLTEPAP